MTATSLVDGEDNFLAGGIELLDQFVDERCADQRMVDQAEQQTIGAGG